MTAATQFLMNHGTPVLFLVVFLEQIGLPIPSTPWLLAAGALSVGTTLSPLVALEVSVLACLIADLLWFCLGRHRGDRVLRLLCRISLEPVSCVQKAQTFFTRYGMCGVVLAKFLPGFGLAFPPLAGMNRIHSGRFLLYDALGSLLYAGCFILLGLLFSSQLHRFAAAFAEFNRGALWVIASLVTAYITFKYFQRKRLSRRFADAAPQPVLLTRQMM